MVNLLLAVPLAVCGFYWAVAAYIDLGVFAHRCEGYSGVSAVPAVATLAGLPTALIVREWFRWVTNPVVYFVAIGPDVLYQIGELVLWFRVRALGWPDKSGRSTAP
ncbi:MAG: hypothetical protein U0746_19990 [Gemmataceae bacterium]